MQTSKLMSLPLCFWMSEVTENHVIPLGSKVKHYFYWQNADDASRWDESYIFDACAFIVCLCYRKANDEKESWNNFGSSEKQVCLPVSANRNTNESANVYEVTEAKRIQEETLPLVSQRHWSRLKLKCWHVMFLCFLCLSVWLPVCLSLFQHTHSWVHGRNFWI